MHSWSLLFRFAVIASAVAQSDTSTSSAPAALPTVPYASDDPNYSLWTAESLDADPEPVRGKLGAKILGPENIPIELENSNALAPPSTDHGAV